MNRRHVISALGAFPLLGHAARAQGIPPYEASIILGGGMEAGLFIKMQPDWKTYWRMPGDAGIPPQFDWTGSSNMSAVEVLYPVPQRFRDLAGETIGYKDEVVFPLRVTPVAADQPVQLKLNLFFAVCKDICIPANAALTGGPMPGEPSMLLQVWKKRVPQVSPIPAVRRARLEEPEGKLTLVLKIDADASDIFVESATPAYFGKPMIDAASGIARLPVANLRDKAALQNQPLKITLALAKGGIEQSITVA